MAATKKRAERLESGTLSIQGPRTGDGDGEPAEMRAVAGPDFKLLFESVPGLRLVLRPDAPRFTVAAASDAFAREVGTRREELLGRAFFELAPAKLLSPGADQGAFEASLARVIQTRSPDVIGLRKYLFHRAGRPNGGQNGASDERWLRVLHSPVLGPRGDVAYIIHELEDATELVRIERLRDDWLSMVAHDLLQPLHTIFGYAQILARDMQASVEAPRSRRYVEQIRRSSELLARMVSDLRDASRIDAGLMRMDCSEVDLLSVVQQAIERSPELAERCQVRVEPATDTRAWGDPSRVEQVLRNLLTNAAKYSDPGTAIAIDVASDGRDVRVTVANRGPGILPGDLARIFDRFEPDAKARVSGATGLGLGLHIAKGLIEAQGGRIWAESTLGSVTRFPFTLPLARQGAA